MGTNHSRRDFLKTSALTALSAPALLSSCSVRNPSEKKEAATVGKGLNKESKKICVEEHWLMETGKAPTLPPSLNTAAFPEIKQRLRPSNFEFRIPIMDELGIKVQVLCPPGAGVQHVKNRTDAIKLAQKSNDALATIIDKYPKRFAGYATIPTQDPRAAADETERAVTQLGLMGVMIYSHTNDEYLDEQKFWPIWEKAEELGVPIYIHPMEPVSLLRKYFQGHPELMGPIWSWTVDTATHALRIVGAGVFDAFPESTLILGHLGETLPFLMGRLDQGYKLSHKSIVLKKNFQLISGRISLSPRVVNTARKRWSAPSVPWEQIESYLLWTILLYHPTNQ